jgi:hypothetical protein
VLLPPSSGLRVAHAVAPWITPTLGSTYQQGIEAPSRMQVRGTTPPSEPMPATRLRFANLGFVEYISWKNPSQLPELQPFQGDHAAWRFCASVPEAAQ